MSNRRRPQPAAAINGAAARVAGAARGQGGEDAGKINLYLCPTGHRRFTINRDTGTTPSGMLCGQVVVGKVENPRDLAAVGTCQERAMSTWYRLPPDFHLRMVTHEWWLPTVAQALTWPNVPRRQREDIADHVRMGGMMLAILTDETAELYSVGHRAGRDSIDGQ